MSDKSTESEIRSLLAGWAGAVEAKGPARIASVYAADVVAFDAILALRFEGREAYGAHWQACLSHCPGEMAFKIHDLKIEASGDIAFCHGLVRCGGAGPDGQMQSAWMRMTIGLRREAGAWRIVHEHHSAPFDVESFKALFDLEPEGEPEALVA